ncbi:serine/threonine-protein kinase [Candidatus Magnetominusculus xianensis]|uniref:serine/threonine-protein kinase n=1 Tax=Candidatus Magnetominusculus xianensis TaxID=1748249 RepID=UPI0019E86F36|nr:serine/threonine-protein kinase [Candidatus Magnetominusculus xianensis]MBF0403935.1 protein kinase [Nitrospirota bacterium]
MSKPEIQKVGKYDVKEELGHGAMAVVYRGYDPFINREVAIKITDTDRGNDKDSAAHRRRLFFNEARIAAMLDHPNIIHVHDAGIEGSYCYLVMEYVKGAKTLKEFNKKNEILPVEKVIEIIFKCCKALDYAHSMGVVHRDIKPSNIMMTSDMDVKIGDFSIAQIISAEVTQIGGIIGSPKYMSPEQVKEEEITSQTDLFSLGSVMYELLAHVVPFDSENVSSLVFKIVNETPLPVSHYNKDIPEELEQIVQKAMAKDPRNRYPRGLDFAADLSKVYRNLKRPVVDIKEQAKFEQMKKLNFFRGFFDSELTEVIRAGAWEQYGVGEHIITEGDIDDSFYVIISGDVLVKKGDKAIVALKPGDCFGEMGYLAKTQRTADIVSLTPVSLIKVSGTLIEKMTVHCQLRFNRIFLRTLIARLSKTSEELAKYRPL